VAKGVQLTMHAHQAGALTSTVAFWVHVPPPHATNTGLWEVGPSRRPPAAPGPALATPGAAGQPWHRSKARRQQAQMCWVA